VGQIRAREMSFLPTQRSFRFLFSAAVVLMMIGGSAICYEKSQWRSVEIMNPEWSTTVPVTAKRGQTSIHAISVRCRGKLDGSASIRIGESSAELVFGGDKFDVEIQKRDW
jgi:hypothetical protein